MNDQNSLKLILIVVIVYFFPVQRAETMPAFARKYQISCQVCHSPVPRLKPFGEEFAGNGFRLKEYESPRYYIPGGDEKLSLLREVPLGIRFDGFSSFNFGNNRSVDFGIPFGLKIISGGELSEKFSYYFYFYLNERGSIAGVEDALLIYNDLLGSGVNISLGQFQACDPLYKRETRLTLEDYRIYTVKPGTSSAGLKYDRGIIFDYGLPSGTDIVFQVLNGSGIGEADDEFLFDKDKYKNIMGKVSQSFGQIISIGFFGYSGKELVTDSAITNISNIKMYGPNLTLDFSEKLILNFQYLRRTDSRVYLSSEDIFKPDIGTSGGFAEVIFSPKGDDSRWYLTGLYNWVKSDISELDYSSFTFHAGLILRRNLRLVSEFTWLDSTESYGRFSIGFVSGF